MTPRAALPVLVLTALLLAACGERGGGGAGERPDGAQDPLLPIPQASGTGVTGMPGAGTPGPRPGEVVAAQAVVPVDADGNPLPPEALAGVEGPEVPNPESGGADEPSPAEAIAVIRDYYSAINAGDYGNAYQLWADGGRASNQSLDAFEDGFAQTRGVSVEIGQPGNGDAVTGARLVEVPVTLLATQRDDTIRRFTGFYTLRRNVPGAEGASLEQFQWQIVSASLVEAN